MSFKKSLLAIAVFEVICCSTQAATVKYVDTFGKPMFALNFVNDYARQDEEGNLWSLTEDQRNAIVDAASIWGELFAKTVVIPLICQYQSSLCMRLVMITMPQPVPF